MIGIKKPVPKLCIECPCFETISALGKIEGEEWLIRRCAANGKTIRMFLYLVDGVEQKPFEEWYDFTRPDWCPLVEIVHCKDCKYAHMTINGECKYCDIWWPDEKHYVSGSHFCAEGERRGE